MRAFINGIVFTLVALIAAGIAGVWYGVLPAGADAKPLPFEHWAAMRSLHASIAKETVGVVNPLQPTDANLAGGLKLYGANCAVCHGAADAKPSNLALGFYIAAPQLAKDGVEDDPESVTHWKLVHGIRFSAMPAFSGTLSDDDLWKITLFVNHMDKLPAAIDTAWKQLPSVAGSPAPSMEPSPEASAESSAQPVDASSAEPSAEPSASP
jgi:mono/diheme cytochrome c family protein